MRLDFLCGCVRFACIRAFFFCYYGGDTMLDSEKIEVLESEIKYLHNCEKLMQLHINDLERMLNTNKDNLDYLVEKGVFSDSLTVDRLEDMIRCMKLCSSLRNTKFLDPKEENEEPDHYLLHIFEIRR